MIAICVGHSRPWDDGAVSVDGTTEWFYHSRMAERLAVLLDAAGIPNQVIDEYQGRTYTAAMRWLGRELKKLGATLALELHFNAAASRNTSGHEWLYWHASAAGKLAARRMEAGMAASYPKMPARGCKPVSAGNGAGFLRLTPCPAVICEPFFGTSPEDWETVAEDPQKLALALANGVIALGGGRA